MSKFEIVKRSAGKYELVGMLDQKTVSSVWQHRSKLVPENGQMLVLLHFQDLASVTHSDSSGLALLTCIQSEANKTGYTLSFTNIPEQLNKLIELSHLEDVLNYDSTL